VNCYKNLQIVQFWGKPIRERERQRRVVFNQSGYSWHHLDKMTESFPMKMKWLSIHNLLRYTLIFIENLKGTMNNLVWFLKHPSPILLFVSEMNMCQKSLWFFITWNYNFVKPRDRCRYVIMKSERKQYLKVKNDIWKVKKQCAKLKWRNDMWKVKKQCAKLKWRNDMWKVKNDMWKVKRRYVKSEETICEIKVKKRYVKSE